MTELVKKFEYIGWDVGGAHLKMAQLSPSGEVIEVLQLPTPIWQGLEQLTDQLHALRDKYTKHAKHTLTMTAELADVFPNRETGVVQIAKIFNSIFGEVSFYAGNQGVVSMDNIDSYKNDIASANWHAAAKLVAEHITKGVFLDVGSTTTDIIRVEKGKVCNIGKDDYTRLGSGELAYTGVVRTPVMALTAQVPFMGSWQPLVAENFASCADIYRITGELCEEDDLLPAEDNQVKTINSSMQRLARMLGKDFLSSDNPTVWQEVAAYLSHQQLQKITHALACVMSYPPVLERPCLIGAGCGRFLVQKLAQRLSCEYQDFSQLLKTPPKHAQAVNRAAPAVALAYLSMRV